MNHHVSVIAGLSLINTSMVLNLVYLYQEYVSHLNKIDWLRETRLLVTAILFAGVMYVSFYLCFSCFLSYHSFSVGIEQFIFRFPAWARFADWTFDWTVYLYDIMQSLFAWSSASRP